MMNFWRRLGAWRWLVASVAVMVIFSMLGGITNLLYMVFLFAFFYLLLKVFMIITKRFSDSEDEANDPYWGKTEVTPIKKRTPTAGPKTDGVITQTEKELFDELTSELTGDEYDPPIPLQWSSLNPFQKSKKHNH